MRKKLVRFQEIKSRKNIIEPGTPLYENIKGNWHQFFQNEQPIVLELGCGKGEYTTGLATIAPGKNYIGVDVKGDRIWAGSTMALEKELHAVAFLRTQIQHLEEFFAPGEVSEIWITFPDPRPKVRDIKRRLTSPRFLGVYQNILKQAGKIHVKTDNKDLFDYTLEILRAKGVDNLVHTFDLYRTDMQYQLPPIQTNFEKVYLSEGIPIKYLSFSFF